MNSKKATSITWCEMQNNTNVMSQPAVPYEWPNSEDDSGNLFPGLKTLYSEDNTWTTKQAPGVYVNEIVVVALDEVAEA